MILNIFYKYRLEIKSAGPYRRLLRNKIWLSRIMFSGVNTTGGSLRSTRNIGIIRATIRHQGPSSWLKPDFISLADSSRDGKRRPTHNRSGRFSGKTRQNAFTATQLFTHGRPTMTSGSNTPNGAQNAGK